MAIIQTKPNRKYCVLDVNNIVTEIFTIATRSSWDDTLLKVLELANFVPPIGWEWTGSKFVDPAALPPPPDYSNMDNLPKVMKTLGLLIAQYANKTPAQVKSDFLAIYTSLP